MKIIVAGCGKVGRELTQRLSQEGHAVTAIDIDPKRIQEIGDQYDVMGVNGSCVTLSVQLEAQADKADLLIATTESDELNLLACLVAKKLGAKHTIARVRDPQYTRRQDKTGSLIDFLSEELGLSMYLNPEFAAASEISRLLRFPNAHTVDVFAGGRAEIVEVTADKSSSLPGLTLQELNRGFARVLVCAVQRSEDVFIPTGDFRLQEGDRISITGEPSEISRLFRRLGLLKKKADRVLIVGGGRIAYYLAVSLAGAGTRVTIMEQDEERCKTLCELLPDANIMLGDGTDHELLGEVGAGEMDGIAALTGSDEVNIILGLYAASLGAGKTVVKVNNGNLIGLGEQAGLGSVVSPKHTTANMILSYVRGMSATMDSNVEALHSLCGGKVEALEFSVGREVEGVCGVPLKDLNTRPGLLLACIIRDGRPLIPGGGDVIRRGDHVLVVTTADGLEDIKDILE
jgi:trk system potassium uptake protein TrkA